MNLFEKQFFEAFISALESDSEVPQNLVQTIKELHETNKISKGTTLRKAIENLDLKAREE